MMNDRVFPVWVADQRFAYNTLERWAVNDPLLAGKLDVTRIGSFGHSFGGATALEVCRSDTRCRAAVNMDGGLYGKIVTEPAVELPGSTHYSFTITQLLSPLLVPKGFDPRAGLRIVDKYLRTFFDIHLRGMEKLPLEPASGQTDVRWLANRKIRSPSSTTWPRRQ